MAVVLDFEKILVPVNAERLWQSAIEFASTLARKGLTTIYLVYVIELERSVSLDAEVNPERIKKAEEVMGQAKEMLAKEGYEVESVLLQARECGPAIVEEAAEIGADLILVGMDYTKRFGFVAPEEAVTYILQQATCPVLVIREPPPQELSI